MKYPRQVRYKAKKSFLKLSYLLQVRKIYSVLTSLLFFLLQYSCYLTRYSWSVWFYAQHCRISLIFFFAELNHVKTVLPLIDCNRVFFFLRTDYFFITNLIAVCLRRVYIIVRSTWTHQLTDYQTKSISSSSSWGVGNTSPIS